jgi:hypothetical protein
MKGQSPTGFAWIYCISVMVVAGVAAFRFLEAKPDVDWKTYAWCILGILAYVFGTIFLYNVIKRFLKR